MNPIDIAHDSYVVKAERATILGRYALIVVMLVRYLAGYWQAGFAELALISVLLLMHNAYAHALILWKRQARFYSSGNFLLHFSEATLLIALTGPRHTEAYLLYVCLVIALSGIPKRESHVGHVAVLCAASYLTLVLLDGARVGVVLFTSDHIVRGSAILLAGGLGELIFRRLSASERAAARLEARTASSERTLHSILESSGEPILFFDERELITGANERAGAFFGLPGDQIVGRRIRGYMFDDGTLPQKFAILHTRGEADGEEIFIVGNGEERTVNMTVRSFQYESERAYVAILTDVTGKKESDETTRNAELELERLRTELKQVDRLRAAFLLSISRNMRSPLTAVAGFVDLLLDEKLGEVNQDQRKALQVCRRGLVRAFRLIDEAFDTHRLETRRSMTAPVSENAASTHAASDSPPDERPSDADTVQ